MKNKYLGIDDHDAYKRLDVLAVAVLVAAKAVLLYFVLYFRGFVVFSDEGPTRALLSWWWVKGLTRSGSLGPLLPMHTYLMGLFSLVTGSPFRGAMAVSGITSLLVIPVFFACLRLRGFSTRGAFAAGVFMCMIPWGSYLGISGHPQPLMIFLILSGLLIVAVWDRLETPREKPKTFKTFLFGYNEPRDVLVILSGLVFMVAVMTDLAAWAVLVVVSALYGWRVARFRMNPPTFLVWLALAWVAPLFWCVRGALFSQDFFYVFRARIAAPPTGPGQFLESLVSAVFSFVLVGPFVFLLITLGVVRYLSLGKPHFYSLSMIIMIFAIGTFTAMGIYEQKSMLEAITPAVVLGSAMAGNIFLRLWHDKRWLAVLIIAGAVCQGAVTTWRFAYVTPAARYDTAIKLGRLMGQSWNEDAYLRNTSLVMERSEAHAARFDGRVVGMISGRPEKVYFDDIAIKFDWEGHIYLDKFRRDVQVPNVWCLGIAKRKSMFDLSRRECGGYLKKMRAGVIAVVNLPKFGRFPPNYEFAGRLGRYRIYVDSCADVEAFKRKLAKLGARRELFKPYTDAIGPVRGFQRAKEVLATGVYVRPSDPGAGDFAVRLDGRTCRNGRLIAAAETRTKPSALGQREDELFVTISLPPSVKAGYYDVSLFALGSPNKTAALGKMALGRSKAELVRRYLEEHLGDVFAEGGLPPIARLPRSGEIPTSVFFRVLLSAWW